MKKFEIMQILSIHELSKFFTSMHETVRELQNLFSDTAMCWYVKSSHVVVVNEKNGQYSTYVSVVMGYGEFRFAPISWECIAVPLRHNFISDE